MKYCRECKVAVNNPVRHCPLCFAQLTEKDDAPEELSYPPLLRQAERYNLLLRILVMVSLTIATVCVTVNILAQHRTWWSLIVICGLGYMWIAISTAVRKRARLGYNILLQVISLAVLLVVIDRFSGQSGWALNYVVPFLFVTATLSITVIIIVRRMKSGSFILYMFLTALLGFIPLALVAAGITTVRWPSIASALYSGLSLVSLFIFADRTTKQELRKRFHI